jgi:hypothetical protein
LAWKNSVEQMTDAPQPRAVYTTDAQSLRASADPAHNLRVVANQLAMRWLRIALDTLDDESVRRRYLRVVAQELAPIGMRIDE